MGAFSPSNFIKAKWAWASEKPLFWANLVLAGLTALWIFVYPGPNTEAGPSDFRIRTWGMFLQLLGAVTVWLDLTDSARKFGKGGFLKSTWKWLKAGIFGRTITLHVAGSQHTITGGKARIKQRRTIDPRSPIDSRMEALEYNLNKIDEDLTGAYKEIADSASELKEQIKSETANRQEAHKGLQKDLQEAIVGNYTKLAFGAAWVVVGIVISAWAPELAKMVAGQWSAVVRAI